MSQREKREARLLEGLIYKPTPNPWKETFYYPLALPSKNDYFYATTRIPQHDFERIYGKLDLPNRIGKNQQGYQYEIEKIRQSQKEATKKWEAYKAEYKKKRPSVPQDQLFDFDTEYKRTEYDYHTELDKSKKYEVDYLNALQTIMANGSTTQQETENTTALPSAAALNHEYNLFKIHYFKLSINIVRKNHLTIGQYKPAEITTTQYYVTALPYQLFEFWAINDSCSDFRSPFKNLSKCFPYCTYNSAHIRLSHFIPIQNSLTGTTQQDISTFNTAPYCYIAKDNYGQIPTIYTSDPIDDFTVRRQMVKIKSNHYWDHQNEMGLLNLDEIHIMHQGETQDFNFDFQNRVNQLMQPTPKWNEQKFTMLPMATIDNYHQEYVLETGLAYGVKGPNTNQNMPFIPKYDYPHIFLFLPYIENVNSKDNVSRLYAHILLETDIRMTLYTVPEEADRLNPSIARRNILDNISLPKKVSKLPTQVFQFH